MKSACVVTVHIQSFVFLSTLVLARYVHTGPDNCALIGHSKKLYTYIYIYIYIYTVVHNAMYKSIRQQFSTCNKLKLVARILESE